MHTHKRAHTHTQACTHARTHARTHAHTHMHTPTVKLSLDSIGLLHQPSEVPSQESDKIKLGVNRVRDSKQRRRREVAVEDNEDEESRWRNRD